MFIPQSVQTQLELANIADVKRQIITAKTSKPIIKFKQDTVLGTYKMTESSEKIDYHDAMNLAMYCNSVDIFKIKKEEINTHELYSLIIPAMINYSDGKVNINNGKLLAGVVGNSILNDRIIYYSWDRHGPETTKNFFDNAQRLVTNWLLINGFSVGLGDATTNQEVLDDISIMCNVKQMEVNKMITDMENNPETLDAETFEDQLKNILKASEGEIHSKVYDHLKKNASDNNFYVMIESKAKGSQGNVGQIIGSLGQNVLDFRRIKKKVNNRTMPHFFQNDDRALARGFIPNSYYHGLTPQEFFFHHVTARDGMIDTAVKTSDSGYLQRKLIKGMEDIIIAYDKTVRSGNNVIIQMIYGDNNINQTHYKEVTIKLVMMGNKDVKNKFTFSDSELDELTKDLKLDKNKFTKWNNELYDLMIKLRDELREIQTRFRMSYITMQDMYQLPVNLNRIIDDAKNYHFNSKKERLVPMYVLNAINFMLDSNITNISLNSDDINSIKFHDQKRAKVIFRIALLEYLSPKRCIYEYKLCKEQFDLLIMEIVKSFKKACIEPGEMVGVLTAQSLGETLTQMCMIGSSKIHVRVVNKETNSINIKQTTIGKFIDSLYKKLPTRINNIPNHHDSTEFSLEDLSHDFYICGVNQNEEVKWNKMSHLSRHPTNGNLLKVTTQSGRSITTTKSHNFLKRTPNDGIIAVTSKDLKLKDRIPVARNIEYQSDTDILVFNDFELKVTEKMGWLFGAYLAEGSLNGNQINISNISEEYFNNIYELEKELDVIVKQRKFQGEYGPSTTTSFIHKELADIIRTHFKCGSFNKVIPQFVHNANINFVKGLLRGYFDGDGNVAADRKIIRIGSRSKELIEDVALLLTYFGIFASKYSEVKKDNSTPFYCLGIPHKYARKFLETIGTDFLEKRKGIEAIIEFSESDHQYSSEVIDKIPELGHIIARLGSALKMPGNSRTYGVWERRNMSIGRRTLGIYIERFESRAKEINEVTSVKKDLDYLKMIYNGDVVWDEITKIEEIDDPKEYVYDFTVPNIETFMVNDGIIVHNTLNSVSWNQPILYSDLKNNSNVVKIGEMIDTILLENSDKIDHVDNSTETEYLDIKHLDLKIQSVDEQGKMHWKLIEAITRHLPGGNVVRVKTELGRSVVATKAKSFLIRRDNKIIEIEGSEIKVGDRLPVQRKAPKLDTYLESYKDIQLTGDVGHAFGAYLSNAVDNNLNIIKDDPDFIKVFKSLKTDSAISILPKDRLIPGWVFIANNEFVKGLLEGFFFGDTFHNIHKAIIKKSDNLLLGIAELMTRFNMVANIKDSAISVKELDDLIIPGIKFHDLDGEYTMKQLLDLYNTTDNITFKKFLGKTLNEDAYYDKIISIEDLPLSEVTPNHNKVYDLTVADTKNFNIFGGLCMRDTFHSSGVGVKGMQGIPRFREVLSYSKKIQTPYMIIKLIPEVRSDQYLAHKIEAYLKHTLFGNLVDKMDIVYDPEPERLLNKDNINKSNVYYVNGGNVPIENFTWLYRFTISRESMLENDITLLDIKTKFVKFWDDYLNDSTSNKKKSVLSKVSNGCIISNFDNSESPIVHIRFDIATPNNYMLVEIGNYILEKISIKGVQTIDKVDKVEKQKVIEYDEDFAIKSNANEWVIYTTGIDVDKIKTNRFIDFKTVYINDIYKVYLEFGVEAARNLIIKETNQLYAGSGNPLNIPHLALLADVMTNTGNITSIDRHGINRLDTDPLSRASFEKTVEQLIIASAFNETDYMRSVSSRIMAGRCIKGGTGLCDVIMDNDFIENSEISTTKTFIKSNVTQSLSQNDNITDIMNRELEEDIFIP